MGSKVGAVTTGGATGGTSSGAGPTCCGIGAAEPDVAEDVVAVFVGVGVGFGHAAKDTAVSTVLLVSELGSET